MSVLITGMEMPATCFKCKVSRMTPSVYAWCVLTEKCYPADEPPPLECPMIPLPPHGRLGDLDELENRLNVLCQDSPTLTQMANDFVNSGIRASIKCLIDAPTIIPADKEG